MGDTSLVADPILITASVSYVKYFSEAGQISLGSVTLKSPLITHYPPAERNPDLDQEIDCSQTIFASDGITELYPYVTQLSITVHGEWYNKVLGQGPITLTISIPAVFGEGEVWDGGAISLVLTFATVDVATELTRSNWVKWSDIGSADFDTTRSNIAGERPLDWNGWVYRVMKLNNKVAVYGQGGVSLLIPVGNTYGLDTIHRVGLFGRGTVTGSDKKHFFIDKDGNLWKVDEGIKNYGYSEFLSQLSPSTVMSYDSLNNVIYICDGDSGFIFDIETESLGECAGNISGFGYRAGIQYVTGPSTIDSPAFELCTDIIDFGTRATKTINFIELGVNLSDDIYVAVSYRRNTSSDFITTPWRLANSLGRVSLNVFGVEFMIHVKVLSYTNFRLDYIKIDGVQNDY